MADTKNKKTKTKKYNLSEEQKLRLKDAIRYCAFGDFSMENALKFINNGLLGYTDKKDAANKLVPVTIERATYYRYREEALDDNEIRKDFMDFVKTKYMVEMRNILSVVKMIMSLTQQKIGRASCRERV